MIKIILIAFLVTAFTQTPLLQDRVKALEELCQLIDSNKEFRPLHIDSYVYNKWNIRIGASGEEYYYKNDSISKIEYYIRTRKHYDAYTFYFNKGELIKASYRNDKKMNLEEYVFYFDDRQLLNTSPEVTKVKREVDYSLRQSYDLFKRGEKIIKDWSHQKE